jgi:predicted nuclease of predicted toxin-antitoxin system
MKVLLDTCVWGGAAETLRSAGHDVRWMGEAEPDPGDDAILQRAFDEDRVLVTLDKDFGELAVVYGRPHRGIIRLVGLPARRQGAYCAELLQRYGSELARGAILTATAERVRIRPGQDLKHGADSATPQQD